MKQLIAKRRISINLLGTIMKVGLTLMKNLLTSLAKNVSIPVELTTAASVTNTAVKKENYGL